MEKAKDYLKVNKEEGGAVSRISFPPHKIRVQSSFYEDFGLKGIRVDRVEPGFVSCTFVVPPHLTDREGNLASGAIANIVDEVGGAVVYVDGMNVSVDMSISFLSTAKLHDELEITTRILGRKGGYSAADVLIRNKATGELVAEGRHSLFGRHVSKI